MHPTRIVLTGFVGATLIGSTLLSLPVATSGPDAAPFMTAFFTAVSAVCVTGLVVVDTGAYWSLWGQAIILLLFQLGGFGIMTAATLLGLLVNRSLRLKTRLITQVESHNVSAGELRAILKLVAMVTFSIEIAIATILTLNLYWVYDESLPTALWNGAFHAVSAFNNAGFALYPDGLMRFASDAFILWPIMIAIIVGGIGFPVLFDLKQRYQRLRGLSLHSKITLSGTAILLVLGTLAILLFEHDNPGTLGVMGWPDKMLNALFASVSARTAGFNAVDVGALTQETYSVHFLLMFIGGGSAGTAGGVKVGTFCVLMLIVLAEIRGNRDTVAFGRRIDTATQREAITVLVLGSAVVVVGTLILLSHSDFPMSAIIFEVISAFATVGLSTGITAELDTVSQVTLTALMLIGRVGTITVAAAMAMGSMPTSYRYPEERTIVG